MFIVAWLVTEHITADDHPNFEINLDSMQYNLLKV